MVWSCKARRQRKQKEKSILPWVPAQAVWSDLPRRPRLAIALPPQIPSDCASADGICKMKAQQKLFQAEWGEKLLGHFFFDFGDRHAHSTQHARAHTLDTMCHRSQVSSKNQPAKSVTHFTLEVLLQGSQDMQLHMQVQGTGQVPLPIHNRSFVAHGRL